VEFQRRSGDSVAFNQVYQEASAQLQKYDNGTDSGKVPPAPPLFESLLLPRDPAVVSLNEDDMGPVLDMANLAGSPQLQAEAATVLAGLAVESLPIVLSTVVFQSIAGLMEASSAEVANSTAHLVHQLAQHDEAVSFFIEHGILPQMLKQTASPDLSAKCRFEYAQAVNSVSQRLPKEISHRMVADLLEATSRCASECIVSGHHNMVQELEMCELALKCRLGLP
jgi:hypothetical protein